jgi:preprotein translocase subunit SecE
MRNTVAVEGLARSSLLVLVTVSVLSVFLTVPDLCIS